MIIDGKILSEPIREEIKKKVTELKQKGINPKIAIVTVGAEESWKTYVAQKLKFADEYGIKKELINLSEGNEQALFETAKRLNSDESIHGIIVQRPLPDFVDREILNKIISPVKDIDGFRTDSLHEVPVWQAVKRILEEAMLLSPHPGTNSVHIKLNHFLANKNIVVIGKGESAGRLIINGLIQLRATPIVIDSKTEGKSEILKNADIIISCVGKKVIEAIELKHGVILVGVGLHRNEDGKLAGDYDQTEISDIASFYTPTPGGVGPLNLTYLFKNLISSSPQK